MRGFFRIVCIVFFLFCVTPAARGEGTWYLRVIAKDDSPKAQEEKLQVRDAAWAACPPCLDELPEALDRIRKAAEEIAPCTVEIREWTPGDGMPAAPTLYITIGEGKGHNWWGVLYRDAVRLARAEGEDAGAVSFIWPVWEWLLRLFGG